MIHQSPPKLYSPPFVFRDSIYENPSACWGNIFNDGIILTTYNTRSLGCIEATYLLIHNRAIRKANVTIPSSSGGGLEIDWQFRPDQQAYHTWYAWEPVRRAYSRPWYISCNCSAIPPLFAKSWLKINSLCFQSSTIDLQRGFDPIEPLEPPPPPLLRAWYVHVQTELHYFDLECLTSHAMSQHTRASRSINSIFQMAL